MLRNIGVNWREIRLIRNSYIGQRVKLRLDQGEADSLKIGRGFRQGCCMSPVFFNLYAEYSMKEALLEVGDFKIGGRIINVIFADDTAIIAKPQEEIKI
jgi:Reverse transcriptase (RNA-dependent DNA polymerase).